MRLASHHDTVRSVVHLASMLVLSFVGHNNRDVFFFLKVIVCFICLTCSLLYCNNIISWFIYNAKFESLGNLV